MNFQRQTQSVYRSQHPEVERHWGEIQEALREFSRRLKQLRGDYNIPDEIEMFGFDEWGSRHFAGFRPEPKIDNAMFRRSKDDLWWPKQTTTEARVLAKRLRELSTPIPSKTPGMPQYVQQSNIRSTSSIARIEGAIWVGWAYSHDVVEMFGDDPVDLDIWERRPLKEYLDLMQKAEATS